MKRQILSSQLEELLSVYRVSTSLRDMVNTRARLVWFAWRASHFGIQSLAQDAMQAADVLKLDIQKVQP